MRRFAFLALFLLPVAAWSCKEAPPAPPQVIHVQPASHEAGPAPAPSPALPHGPGALPVPELRPLLQSYDLPKGHEKRAFGMLRSVLASGDDAIGRISMGPGGKAVILAPASIHAGIAQVIQELAAVPTEQAVLAIRLDFWLVLGRQSEASMIEIPELAPVLTSLVEAQGPMRFTLLEKVSLLSGDGERASGNGRVLWVEQNTSLVENGAVMVELNLHANRQVEGRASQVQKLNTRLVLAPERTVILGQVGVEDVMHLRGGSELQVGAAEGTLFYVVRATLIRE